MSTAAPAARKFPPKGSVPTPAEQHEDWLRLLRPDGPFVSLPVLVGAFPQGLDNIPDDVRARLRQAWAEVQEDPALLRSSWERFVLTDLLDWRAPGLREGAAVPELLHAGANTPDAVLLGPGQSGLAPRALFFRTDGWGDSLNRPRGEQPGLADRAADLCRARGVPLALLTNGREWALVHARPKEATTVAVFDADLWFEEPILARAFASLFSARRVIRPPLDAQGKPTDSTAGLFDRTAKDRSEVTDTLGRQVREAVSLLVAELSRLDREERGRLLDGVPAKDVYEGALTVMMRLVFLLYAEEQRLLPAGDELYDASYAVGPLHEDLATARSLHGDELGDLVQATWSRLLAVFAAIHGGCTHDRLWIPAYGGSLFDPSRFPWLVDAKVTDRVVYEILDALLTLRARKGFKGRERLSYKGLDVEQIGHVYEGLLEYGCRWADEPYVGVSFGRDKKYEAVLPLARLEEWAAAGTLADEVAAATGTKAPTVTAALGKSGTVTGELETACANDAALVERAAAFSGLYGTDLRDEPKVWPAGSVVVVRSGNRRDTGTHYTPKALAEEVVEHTLAPLCYAPGPAEGAEQGVWQAKSADKLLKLRILDPAMGSGAFLVSACRYLSDRVVEAWLREPELPPEIKRDVDRDDHEQLHQIARRLVADRCLYGVDRDPMAVELAKLSLWLVTLAKGRPFSFLDHALRCGDSLVGCLTADQIEAFHLVPSEGRSLNVRLSGEIDKVIGPLLARAAELRRDIEEHQVLDIRDVRAKAAKLAEAESLTEHLRLSADTVVAAKLSTATAKSGTAYDDRLASIADLVGRALQGDKAAETEARRIVDAWLLGPGGGPRATPLRPLHWPLEFPEIMVDPVRGHRGFDAVVGNPPFIGGTEISGRIGKDSLSYIGQVVADGFTSGGRADLCTYFLLRDLHLTQGGRVGLILVNTIAQGDSHDVGLARVDTYRGKIVRAIKSQPWPGQASVFVSLVWISKSDKPEKVVLDGTDVSEISSSLTRPSRITGRPYVLKTFSGQSSQGCKTTGTGFLLAPDEARALTSKDPRNTNVIRPYLINDEVNNQPDSSAMRWAIDFNEMSEEEARTYPEVFAVIEERVRPVRQRKSPDGSFALRRPLPQRWWLYGDNRTAMRKEIADFDRVLVIGLHSKYGLPSIVPAGQVYSNSLAVFYTPDQAAMLALLTSTWHFNWWTVKGESTLKSDPRYTPSDGFDTFPQPALTDRIRAAGEELHAYRRHLQLGRTPQLGMTDLYNEVHNPANHDADIQRLREIHVEIDQAVTESYLAHPFVTQFGWAPLDLNNDFHQTSHGLRWTVDPSVQTEMNDRLLELNHAVYADEVRRGLHNKKGTAKRKQPAGTADNSGGTLF
ncbi:Eco57I restriction-modification methylase domain-containing protein [Streptomyces europaeiscabiei]|uniref:Eco57I restriction-modification methylase domain-containing protein n=1 Tax=Streptomyces europaeiscabiei TaxID=146819 RepID=UPI002E18CFBF